VQLSRVAAVLCALLALSTPLVCAAQNASGEPILHPAWIAEPGIGDVVVYVADGVWGTNSNNSASLYVVTIQRSNPGNAINGITKDVPGLDHYLRANSTFRAVDVVAISSSRDLIRFFFRSEDKAFTAAFHYPRADLRRASLEDWNRLRAIGIADFAQFLAKRAAVQASAERQLLGARVPPAEERTLQLRLKIQTGSPHDAEMLGSMLKQKRFDSSAPELSITTEGTNVQLIARFAFSEAVAQNLMTDLCADVSKHGARCVDWSGKFDTIRVPL
jgi:hypothetical protein